jgi:hypothetical protein
MSVSLQPCGFRFYNPFSVAGVAFPFKERSDMGIQSHGLQPNHRAGPALFPRHMLEGQSPMLADVAS